MIALKVSGGGLVFCHKVTIKLELNYEKSLKVPMECMLHCCHQLYHSNAAMKNSCFSGSKYSMMLYINMLINELTEYNNAN